MRRCRTLSPRSTKIVMSTAICRQRSDCSCSAMSVIRLRSVNDRSAKQPKWMGQRRLDWALGSGPTSRCRKGRSHLLRGNLRLNRPLLDRPIGLMLDDLRSIDAGYRTIEPFSDIASVDIYRRAQLRMLKLKGRHCCTHPCRERQRRIAVDRLKKVQRGSVWC